MLPERLNQCESYRLKRGGGRIATLGSSMERIPPLSRVDTKMHCIKVLGESVMAMDLDQQVAELQIRIAVLNRDTALGTG